MALDDLVRRTTGEGRYVRDVRPRIATVFHFDVDGRPIVDRRRRIARPVEGRTKRSNVRAHWIEEDRDGSERRDHVANARHRAAAERSADRHGSRVDRCVNDRIQFKEQRRIARFANNAANACRSLR